MQLNFVESIVESVFALGLFVNAILFIPQAIAIYKSKNAEGQSLFTFAGFNLIQLFTIFHAYIHKDFLLLIGYFAAFISCGAVTVLIILYRNKTHNH